MPRSALISMYSRVWACLARMRVSLRSITVASGSAASATPKPRTPWMSCGVMTSSCGIHGTVNERIERESRLATVAGAPSGTVGRRLSTPSACSMMTLRWVTPSKRNRPSSPEPRVDVGQDVDGGRHLGERVAARVERIDHGGHEVSRNGKAPTDDPSRPAVRTIERLSDQAASRGTMPAAASWTCLAVFSAAWSTEASNTSAAFDTMAGPRADDQAGLVTARSVDRLEQDRDGGLGTLVAGDLGGRREAVLAGGRDLAEHRPKRVVGAGLQRDGFAAVVAVELVLEQVAERRRHGEDGH